jgi:hypothetical protein
MASTFQSLNVNQKYKVIGYQLINTKYGQSYILLVEGNPNFELFATKYINKFIAAGNIPKGGFEFKVSEEEIKKVNLESNTTEVTKIKVAKIDGYNPQKFILF